MKGWRIAISRRAPKGLRFRAPGVGKIVPKGGERLGFVTTYGFVKNKEKARVFESLEEAEEMAKMLRKTTSKRGRDLAFHVV